MRFSITTALTFTLVGSAFASPGVSPASVKGKADPGSAFIVDKVVTTPEILPKPDVVLLVDVTGSMTNALQDIKDNLIKVVTAVNAQPDAKFAVVSFGDLRDPDGGFKVVQDLTDNFNDIEDAVNSLTAAGGDDVEEDWINALFQVSNGAVTFRPLGSSTRIIVLVSDNPSHDPSGGHSLQEATDALVGAHIRVIGVDVTTPGNEGLDGKDQATKVTSTTGGVIIPAGSGADAVSSAIISGLKKLDVTIKPHVVSCDAGLTLTFQPAAITVSSGSVVNFLETVKVASGATQDTTLRCSVSFLLNGTPGGDAFIQSVAVKVNILGCDTCNPNPGKNLCHITTSCAPTPFGTMCLTRPGYKADGVADDDLKVQWRLKWPVPGHEHRVAVKPGTSADTLCDPGNTGPNVCKEVAVGACRKVVPVLEGSRDEDQRVISEGEL
ncbi:hypothetical protein EDB81DRAFT_924320 [Dactylonectria macrodidyma]|uniref:VWFA domain-containing protein n=1 Tax=Dactylonectria macrodidyma TaxID=307937 RepID=A0A9P9FFG4_9HYPO|nr:hypothetical protein EDB81DRAFT_924320 [Dactylonectria macrodidyma]